MPIRYIARKVERFFVYRVLSLDDTPHRIALGVAIGIFVTWTPTIGFQMALTVGLSLLMRANKFVGVPFVWISNPATLFPIYWPSYALGRWLLAGHYGGGFDALAGAVHASGWLARVKAFWVATWDIFAPLWVGSLIVGAVLGVITYVLIYYAVISFRKKKRQFMEAHRAREVARAEAEGPE